MEVGEAALEDILFRHSSGFFVPNSLMFLLVAHHQKGNPGGRKWISKQKKLEEGEAAEEEIRRKICTGIRFGLHFGSIGKLGVEQPRGGVTPVY